MLRNSILKWLDTAWTLIWVPPWLFLVALWFIFYIVPREYIRNRRKVEQLRKSMLNESARAPLQATIDQAKKDL